MNTDVLSSTAGIIQTLMPASGSCGSYIITILSDTGSICLYLTPQTYVVNHEFLRPGMKIAAFYQADAPLPEEQHSAYPVMLVTSLAEETNVMLSYFDQTLTASNQSLRLNISPQTDILTANGQRFTCHPGDHILLVYYKSCTKSIPPQTSPLKLIAF